MALDDAPLSEVEKLKALRQIQSALGRQAHPMLRACGLTEEVAVKLANGGLIEVYESGEDEAKSELDKYKVDKIAEEGLGILARGDVEELPPLKISVVPHPASLWSKILRATGSGLWDLIKIPISALVGYYVGKNFH